MDFVEIILWVPGILAALTFHEYAHARVAYELGDPTPAHFRRLTLNPLAHLDVLGTIALFVFRIGWAKPVPINPYYFRNPRRDIALVSVAGPAMNFFIALVSSVIAKILSGDTMSALGRMLLYTAQINIVLMAFNLVPIPPLDGSKIVFSIFNTSPETQMQLTRYGPIILFALIFVGSYAGIDFFRMIIAPFWAIFYRIFWM